MGKHCAGFISTCAGIPSALRRRGDVTEKIVPTALEMSLYILSTLSILSSIHPIHTIHLIHTIKYESTLSVLTTLAILSILSQQ